MTLTREQRIPHGYEEIMREDKYGILVVASPDGLSVKAFKGKAKKPAFFLRFSNAEKARGFVDHWAIDVRRQQDEIKARRAPHSLKVGDVLVCSWGYDQTNVDYYEVTALIGVRMIELREIATETIEAGPSAMTGRSVPMVGQYIAEAIRKQADIDGRVRLGERRYASPLGYTEVEGVRVYNSSRYSSYA